MDRFHHNAGQAARILSLGKLFGGNFPIKPIRHFSFKIFSVGSWVDILSLGFGPYGVKYLEMFRAILSLIKMRLRIT